MRKVSLLCLLFLISSTALSVVAQNPQTTPTPASDEETIEVSTNLIRVDVVVTDKKNRPVTNLDLDDFEIYENGKKQDISDFSYVSPKSRNRTAVSSADSLGLKDGNDGTSLRDKISIPTKIPASGPNDIRRTIVLAVDNLGLSFPSVGIVKKSLEKFIKEQIREGDLVTVVTTGGASVLPSFTSDKKQLLAIVKKIKWAARSRGGADYYDPIKLTLLEELSENAGMDLPGLKQEQAFLEDAELNRKNELAIGTIGSLQYVVRGMRDLPGRKSLVLFSEGFSLSNRTNRNSSTANGELSPSTPNPSQFSRYGSNVPDALELLIKAANQASVVIYPIDPRGLQYLGMANADDDIRQAFGRNFKPGQTDDKRTGRDDYFNQTQDGLRVLALETGGFATLNQNDLDKGLERILEDQSYYLLGYITNQDQIDSPNDVFGKVEIRVKNPEFNVRYRSAFYSEEGRNTDVPRTPREKVGQALAYPFKSNEINLNLYSIAGNYAQGDFILFLIHISAEDLEFKRREKGMRTANFDLLAITLNSDEKPIDQFSKNFTFSVNEPTYKNILKKGVVYVLPVALKKSGVYHFRVAIHDSETGKVGAASRFLETPEFEKKRLWISNLTLKSSSNDTAAALEQENDKNMYTDTALRQFSLPVSLNFGAVLYNPQTNGDGAPELEMQTRLILDDKVILETPFEPISTKEQKDLKRIDLAGRIRLSKNLSAGNYIFQIIVKDKLANKKRQIATQWVDFEVLPK